MRIQRIEEFKIGENVHQQIHKLLKKAFGDYYLHRTYNNQLPTFRYLVWEEDQLIGHMAVEHRNININEMVATIFGIADLCIDNNFQSQNIGSKLIQELEELGQKHQIDFIVLVAQNHNFYQKNGFTLVNNLCRWLIVNNNKSLGVGHRRIEQSLMVKAINEQEWPPGLIDFLGHIF